MKWRLTVIQKDGTKEIESFDEDELGTLDDIVTRFFINSFEDTQSVTIEVI